MTRTDTASVLSLSRMRNRFPEDSNMLARFAGDRWRRLGLREDGQDLLEYALLVSLIALVAMGAVTTVGSTIKTVFWDVIAAATAAI
jgi:pilus assembly protein Flp/PilA